MNNAKTRTQRIAALRNALVDKYGPRNYRITSAGEVRIYGLMPHSMVTGWWLMGDIEQAEDWMGIDRLYAPTI